MEDCHLLFPVGLNLPSASRALQHAALRCHERGEVLGWMLKSMPTKGGRGWL